MSKEQRKTELMLLITTARKDLLMKLVGGKKRELQTTKFTATQYIIEMAKHLICAYVHVYMCACIHVFVERRQCMHLWYYAWFQTPIDDSRERR